MLGGNSSDVPYYGAAVPTWQSYVSTAAQTDGTFYTPGVGKLPSGNILLFGGSDGSGGGGANKTALIYDYSGNTDANAASMNSARTQLGFATDENSHIYAIGGKNNSGTVLATVEVYNPGKNSWSYVAPLPKALTEMSAVADGGGHVYVFGGLDSAGNISATVYRYTISTNTWDSTPSPLHAATDGSAAVLGANGKIYVLGGTTAAGATANVESYNPTANTWTVETSLPKPLRLEAATVNYYGRIFVAGGSDAAGNPSSAIYISQQLNQPDAPPVITSATTLSATAGLAYSYQVLSTGNPQPTYSLASFLSGMTIDPITGMIQWTPTLAEVGAQNVVVQASSSVGQTTQSFTVTASLSVPNITTNSPVAVVVEPARDIYGDSHRHAGANV